MPKAIERYSIDSDGAWAWIGYSTKASARRALEAVFKEGQDYRVFHYPVENPTGGRPSETIRLTTACFKKFSMMAGTEVGEAVGRTRDHPSFKSRPNRHRIQKDDEYPRQAVSQIRIVQLNYHNQQQMNGKEGGNNKKFKFIQIHNSVHPWSLLYFPVNEN